MLVRKKLVLISVLAVGITASLGSRDANAASIVGELPNLPIGYDLPSATVIVTGAPTTSALLCGSFEGTAYQAVIITPGQPAIVATLVVNIYDVLSPGTRFTTADFGRFCTSDTTLFSLDLVVTGLVEQKIAVVSAPTSVALALDAEAVVKGHSAADGNANVVVVGQGRPIHTQVWSDFPLEPADRIVDFLLLWDEPATGQTLYMAVVEW